MAWGYPSNTNVFIPNVSTNVEVTANLVVNFSRNSKDFPVNDYVKLIPVKKTDGYYKRMAVGQQARLQYPDARNFDWAPGQERPSGDWNKQGFQDFPYSCKRYSFTTTLDQQTIDQADFQIQPIHVAMLAQQAMTWRSQLVASTVQNSANWDSSHVKTCTTFVGGKLSAATAANPYIMKLFQSAAILINQDTLGVVRARDLTAIMNPVTARTMSETEEWRSYLAQQMNSFKFLQGEDPTPAEHWNLTRKINGIRVLIDDSVMNTVANTPADSQGGSPTNTYTIADGTIVFLGRPGDLKGGEGATDFSTVSLFAYEELATESISDTWNRRVKMAVTDNIDARVSAPPSGMLITACI